MFRSAIVLFVLIIFAMKASEAAPRFLGDAFFAKYSKEYKTLTGQLSKSGGEISYRYPGSLILKQLIPFESQLITNGKTAWYYNAPFDPETEKGEVTISKAKDLPLTEILDSLQGGLKDGPAYKVEKKDGFYLLNLKEDLAKRLEIKSVKLIFKKDKDSLFQNLSKLIIVKSNDLEEEYKFEELNLNPKFSNNHFVFKIPEGTKINR